MADESDTVASIRAIADPIERLRAATAHLATAQQAVNQLAALRRQTIQELHDSGLSLAQIGAAAGLTRARVHQIKHNGPPPESAFFAPGPITIVTPLKKEAIRSRPVVAMEDVAASHRLADTLRAMGMEVSFEHVPVGGDIDLNRTGLVVICGPRLSNNVAAVLDQDPSIRFHQATDGPWVLHDTKSGETYRSGSDQTPATTTDIAYLGRLTRPDGKGRLIVFTGIHAIGSLGVVQFLTSNLADLYEQVGTENFSALIATEYDPEANEPRTVQLLALHKRQKS